jgi:hypothetical protein
MKIGRLLGLVAGCGLAGGACHGVVVFRVWLPPRRRRARQFKPAAHSAVSVLEARSTQAFEGSAIPNGH